MKLFLEYQKLLDEKILNYIDNNFAPSIVSVVAKLYREWKKNQTKNKEIETDLENEINYVSDEE